MAGSCLHSSGFGVSDVMKSVILTFSQIRADESSEPVGNISDLL